MTAYEQRSYPGAAADTLLNADLTSGATSFSVTPGTGTGYPDGSSGPFFVIIDWDNSKAEKIRCSGRVNDTFTVAGSGGGRGQDGTSAQAHTSNAKVRAVITATDLQETNRAAANTIGRITTKGDLTPGSGANTTVRLAVGADGTLLIADSTQAGGVRWTSTGIVLDATSSIGGVTGTSLAADRVAWTAYAPTLTNLTLGNGGLSANYRLVGKTCQVRFSFTFGSTSALGGGIPTFTLPFASVAGPIQGLAGAALDSSAPQGYVLNGRILSGSTTCELVGASSYASSTTPFTWATADTIGLSGVYEIA